MAEAQAQAAGCIRLLSLSDLVKVDLMAAGAVRFLTPLLESKLNQARWNARQVVIVTLIIVIILIKIIVVIIRTTRASQG